MATRPSRRTPGQTDRQREVVELRTQGLSFEQIGQHLGISKPAAWERYQAALNNILAESVNQLRDMENQRLNTAQAAIWPKVLEGDIPALAGLLRIMERRAKLNGLDMPIKTQVEVTHYDGDSIDAEVARLAALLDSGPPNALDTGTGTSGTDTTGGDVE